MNSDLVYIIKLTHTLTLVEYERKHTHSRWIWAIADSALRASSAISSYSTRVRRITVKHTIGKYRNFYRFRLSSAIYYSARVQCQFRCRSIPSIFIVIFYGSFAELFPFTVRLSFHCDDNLCTTVPYFCSVDGEKQSSCRVGMERSKKEEASQESRQGAMNFWICECAFITEYTNYLVGHYGLIEIRVTLVALV